MVVFSSFIYPESQIKYEQRNVQAILDKKDMGMGILYISERTVCWKGPDERGFSLAYPHISLHAVSKDVNVHSKECIYVLIDAHVRMPGDDTAEEEVSITDNSSDDESEANVSELILVPSDSSQVVPMFEVLNECQALNPDPDDVDDDDDNIFEDAEENLDAEFTDDGFVDVGAGGDTEFQNVINRLQNSITINYDNSNGDQQNDEMFEDAD